MHNIEHLLKNNRNWSRQINEKEPDFFPKLARQQAPDFLWIGCSDSRVPANEIVGLLPGELFVHRNVANIIYPSDLNCLSVVEYAVNVLQVRYIIVCGHYGCGGVKTAMEGKPHGIMDNWLIPIKDVYTRHRDDVRSLSTDEKRLNRMCELNVIEQVNPCRTRPSSRTPGNAVRNSRFTDGFTAEDGLIKDLDVCVDRISQVGPTYRFQRECGELSGKGLAGWVFDALNPLEYQAVFGQIMTVLIALEFNHTLQYVVSREQSIIQTKIVLLIGLLALSRQVHHLGFKEATPNELLGLAATNRASDQARGSSTAQTGAGVCHRRLHPRSTRVRCLACRRL